MSLRRRIRRRRRRTSRSQQRDLLRRDGRRRRRGQRSAEETDDASMQHARDARLRRLALRRLLGRSRRRHRRCLPVRSRCTCGSPPRAAVAPQRSERSPIREWLAGNQHRRRRRSPPTAASRSARCRCMGATGSHRDARGANASPDATDLRADGSRAAPRARAGNRTTRRQAPRRARRPRRAATSDVLPFEDFDLASVAVRRHASFSRALTAGPGDYFLYVAWADPAAPKPAARVASIKKRLTLPAATHDRARRSAASSSPTASRCAPRRTRRPNKRRIRTRSA